MRGRDGSARPLCAQGMNGLRKIALCHLLVAGWEKFDYFAVFWGIFAIGLSGLIMWFPELFTRFFPGWIINIALIVHSDEALLAAGFIFTIHFFNTHFRLEKFPMDTVIFSGRISKTEMLHERRRWYDRLVAEDRLEWHRVRTNGRAGRASRVRWVICFSAPVSFSCA